MPRPSRRDATRLTEEKLQLVEFLLSCDNAEESAQRALSWLATPVGARHVLCAVIDPTRARLTGLAAHSPKLPDPRNFTVDLERRSHPLVAALARTEPTVLSSNARDQMEGLELPRARFMVIPLHGPYFHEDVRAAGVMLVSPLLPSVVREARWVASVLGPRLIRLLSYRSAEDTRRRLARERTLMQGVLDASPDPILLTDSEGRILIANAGAEHLFASRDDESEGRRRAVKLNNMFFSAALSWNVMADGAPVRRELLLADPTEGSDLLFELLSGVLMDRQHGPCVVSILRNVTDLRRATEEIEENYRRLRTASAEIRADRDRLNLLIDAVADPILVTDPSGAVIQMNAPAERVFTAPADAAGDAVLRVRSNDAQFSSFVANLRFNADVSSYRGAVSLVDPRSGASLPFDAIAASVLSENGELTGAVTILHDRTETLEKERLYEEVKRAAAELEEKVRHATAELVHQNELLRRQHIQLEQASALKSRFLANMSHEFRTPLNAILGYTRMLLDGVSGRLTKEQEDSLARVDSNAKHLLGIVADILDISSIEAGKMPLRVTEFPIPELISEVMAELEPIIAASKLKLPTELDARAALLWSDRQKVKQIVLNLVSNALKFTPEGSVTVSSRYRRSRDEISIAVRDTGIGIAAGDHAKIFEDFQQADGSLTRPYWGTGLGLSISKRLASMLGGRIELASELGVGSVFTLILPRRMRA